VLKIDTSDLSDDRIHSRSYIGDESSQGPRESDLSGVGEKRIMAGTLVAVCVVGLLIVLWIKRSRDRDAQDRDEMERHSISPQDLHALLASNQDVLLFDVRLPLDLLVDAEIIPGAQRLAPSEVRENPFLIPKDRESVIYCTCPSEETSRAILRRVLAMGFIRVKLLKGGLEAWKSSGFAVEPYRKPFHLDTGV
jgi:rhodanese-related sulfurtransferase